jgi:hypothetical protein
MVDNWIKSKREDIQKEYTRNREIKLVEVRFGGNEKIDWHPGKLV